MQCSYSCINSFGPTPRNRPPATCGGTEDIMSHDAELVLALGWLATDGGDWPNWSKVSDLIAEGTNPNTVIGNEPLLNLALNDCQVDLARQLVAAGADVNRPGKEGRTPLMYAAMMNDDDLIVDLMAAGADALARDCWYRMAFNFLPGPGAPRGERLLLRAMHGPNPPWW